MFTEVKVTQIGDDFIYCVIFSSKLNLPLSYCNYLVFLFLLLIVMKMMFWLGLMIAVMVSVVILEVVMVVVVVLVMVQKWWKPCSSGGSG